MPIGDTEDTLSVFRDWLIKHFKEADKNTTKVKTLMDKVIIYEDKLF